MLPVFLDTCVLLKPYLCDSMLTIADPRLPRRLGPPIRLGSRHAGHVLARPTGLGPGRRPRRTAASGLPLSSAQRLTVRVKADDAVFIAACLASSAPRHPHGRGVHHSGVFRWLPVSQRARCGGPSRRWTVLRRHAAPRGDCLRVPGVVPFTAQKNRRLLPAPTAAMLTSLPSVIMDGNE